MTIFGKRLSEYVAFAKPFLVLTFVVGLVRFALSLGGVENATVKWLSISVIGWLGLLYYAVRVHTTGFGSYKHLLPICVLLMLVAQAIIVPAIVFGILTGTDTIYTAPEYGFGGDGKTWLHAASHLVIGVPAGSLVMWLFGCAIMFVTRKLVRSNGARATARA